MDTYEKKYKEALERAKVWKDRIGMPAYKQGILDDIFPELAGSEDERIRKIIHALHGDVLDMEETNKALAWLEKQGESYTKRDVDDAWLKGMCDAKRELEKQSEQNSSWSKEDDVRLQACIDTLQAESICGKVDTVMTKWLKSLKERYTWKPSEEQIECLHDAINHYQTNGYPASKLNELYEQMSKIYKL